MTSRMLINPLTCKLSGFTCSGYKGCMHCTALVLRFGIGIGIVENDAMLGPKTNMHAIACVDVY